MPHLSAADIPDSGSTVPWGSSFDSPLTASAGGRPSASCKAPSASDLLNRSACRSLPSSSVPCRIGATSSVVNTSLGVLSEDSSYLIR